MRKDAQDPFVVRVSFLGKGPADAGTREGVWVCVVKIMQQGKMGPGALRNHLSTQVPRKTLKHFTQPIKQQILWPDDPRNP